MFADRVGAGVLRWMGWDDQQAFAYTWAAREMLHPQQQDGSAGGKSTATLQNYSHFPHLKESTRNATTERATSTYS